ncbi:MAG: PrsW family intramembrane metalloprotease, partial [Phycisphaerae bacterium]|nr:PrsW family intramembrane metalloprotease [Phycisphaerae bacterium]
AFGALALIWRYDLYDKEPWWAILTAVALGVLGMHYIETPQEILGGWIGNAPARFAFVASMSEESMKLLGVLVFALLISRVFNDPVDGMIYGSLIGLGCAIEESIAYYFNPITQPWGPPTEIIRILGHLVFGGLTGFGIGLLRDPSIPRRHASISFILGFAAAVLLHFLWDLLACRAYLRSTPTNLERAAQVALMLAGFVAYAAALRHAWTHAQRRFQGQHWRRLLSSPKFRRRSLKPKNEVS